MMNLAQPSSITCINSRSLLALSKPKEPPWALPQDNKRIASYLRLKMQQRQLQVQLKTLRAALQRMSGYLDQEFLEILEEVARDQEAVRRKPVEVV
jgi:hypothetical protein